MFAINTQVLGDAEIAREFGDFQSTLRERLRGTLTTLGEELREAAAGMAPRKSGALARSIKARLKEDDKTLTETVSPGKFYARFFEFGTVNHGGRRNRAAGGGKRVKVQRVRALRAVGQYRIRPHPFMGPAMEALRGRIDSALRDVVEKGVVGSGK